MKKRTKQLIILLCLLILPFIFPYSVNAEKPRSRSYYDNVAERARRAGGCDTCYTRADWLNVAFGRDPDAPLYANAMLFLGTDTGVPQGYYLGTRKVTTIIRDARGNEISRSSGIESVIVRFESAPRGGAEPEGSGRSGPPLVVPGIVRVRARELTTTPTSCSDVYASTTYVNSSISVIPEGYPSGSQAANNGNYASWAVFPGTESVSGSPPANYILKMACWQGENPTSSGTGLSAAVAANQTVTWDLGYTNGTSWPQVRGGDVYALNDVSSYIPTTANPRRFLLDGTGNSSAIVTYGNSADFDVTGGTGGSYVSTKNWLAKDNYPRTDYYQLLYRRFGGPTTVNFTNETITQSRATSSATPYYATGDITTSGNWVIGDGESLIMLIDGNLTIGGKIQTTGTGFVAFIVKGNITVSPSVGGAYNSTTPVLQGVYITSPNGVFATGLSTVSGSERFVGKGIFVAGEFQNQRDLSDIGGTNYNNTYAAELYQYDPQLLITMPSAMKDGNIVWQEVAP